MIGGPRRRWRLAALPIAALASLVVVACTDDQPETRRGAGPTTEAARPGAAGAGADRSESLTVRIVERHPHDPDAFTQGLLFDGEGRLFESIGIEGESALREVDPERGATRREVRLPDDEFAEGIALGAGGIVQLTWKDGVAHRWSLDDPDGFERLGTFDYEGEGWGLTGDGSLFVQSNGSPTLTFRDPDTFEPERTVTVIRGGEPVDEVNELEYVDGVLYANVWHSDEIMRIDPATGRVTGVIDASSLWQSPDRTSEMTLNGIAHRPGDPPDRLWLTGKNWPEMFVVDVVPVAAAQQDDGAADGQEGPSDG